MKIALCIAGQPRCIERTYDGVREYILAHHDVDIFAHFWKGGTWKTGVHPIYRGSNHRWDKRYGVDTFCKFYNFTRMMLEEQKTHSGDKPWWPNGPDKRNFISMFYSIMSAVEMVPHLDKYDLVVKYRTDLDLRAPLFQHEIEKGKIYTVAFPKGFHTLGGDNPGVNDLMFYGKPNTMLLAAQAYYHIIHHDYDEAVHLPQAGEVLFGRHLRASNIEYEHIKYDGGLLR